MSAGQGRFKVAKRQVLRAEGRRSKKATAFQNASHVVSDLALSSKGMQAVAEVSKIGGSRIPAAALLREINFKPSTKQLELLFHQSSSLLKSAEFRCET